MIYPIEKYNNKLNLTETFVAIKFLKDNFENELAKQLNLKRVSAPLFVKKKSGLNDDLNGSERPVSFYASSFDDEIEIVQSLAKWKRNALKIYNFSLYEGLYTDMNAIRRDEMTDNLHSIYVDQWDWEKIIDTNDRTLNYLFTTVKTIYNVFLTIENKINQLFPQLNKKLPENIFFISSSELEDLYPNLSRKEREKEICKEKKAVFIYQIGWPLKDGLPHDGRAADYDDWNLNGDILLYSNVLDSQIEVSSMGIRVNNESLIKQIQYKKEEFKLNSPYSINIIKNHLPFTIGGGIGQSRLCMFFLEKAHIGEVQTSIWDEKDTLALKKLNITLL